MPWQPTLLEDSLDPWPVIETDSERRRAVIDFLIALCDAEGRIEHARPLAGTQLLAFGALVPGHDVVIVWVIAETYQQLAIRYLYDVRREQFFGGQHAARPHPRSACRIALGACSGQDGLVGALRTPIALVVLLAACGAGGERADGALSSSTTTTVTTVVTVATTAASSSGSGPIRYDLDGNRESLGGVGPLDFRRVVSADTIEGRHGDELKVVQLLAVDAPPSGECYFDAALAWLEDWMVRFGTGMGIRVPRDGPGFSDRPIVAELVAVEAFERTHDLGSVNVAMVRAGAARYIDPDVSEDPMISDLVDRIKSAEDDARTARRGIWGTCVES